jgi:hypothetical protein
VPLYPPSPSLPLYQKKEFPLSRDAKLHLSTGFVQVPVVESRELYGIKFSGSDNDDAQNFYRKVIIKMGEWS